MARRGFLDKVVPFQPVFLNREKLRRKIEGKTVLITGASSGIGQRLALLLSEFRVHLVVVARREDRLLALKREAEAKAARVSVFAADLRDEQQMGRLLDFLHRLPGGVDIVVSNAGHSIHRSIAGSLDRFHDFTRTMGINYFASVRLILSLAPMLAEKRGHIVNVSTVSVRLAPVPHWAAYLASKGAFDAWFRSVGPELAGMGISVSTVYLPLVRTPMIEPTAAYRHAPAMSPDHAARVIARSFYDGKRAYKPWWLVFGQLASLVLGHRMAMFMPGRRSKEGGEG
jgi:NAD(P)-dependent dehydrogenase (short-subunit alcohol dehydrogenase family)